MLSLMRLVPGSGFCRLPRRGCPQEFPAHSRSASRELARLPTAPEALQAWTQPRLWYGCAHVDSDVRCRGSFDEEPRGKRAASQPAALRSFRSSCPSGFLPEAKTMLAAGQSPAAEWRQLRALFPVRAFPLSPADRAPVIFIRIPRGRTLG